LASAKINAIISELFMNYSIQFTVTMYILSMIC